MLIDWFTVVAQAVNFLILVWLLKRFLYQPVLAAIDTREQKVAAQINDAATREAQAQKERDDFHHQAEALEEQREALLKKANEEAEAERQRLLDGARKDADALRTKLADAVAKDREEINRQIIARTQQEVFSMTRRMLADLAGTSLEDRMTEVFIRRLRESTPTRPTSPVPAVVRSAFELPPPRRAAIAASVQECLGPEVKVSFETSPNLISGIDLTVDGRKISWSGTDYLAVLAKDVTALFDADAGTALEPSAEVQHVLQ